jgi:hypothetical protein
MADLSIAPGRYSGGLLSVLDNAASDACLVDWCWLLGPDAVALCASVFSDLFFWSERMNAVFFLEVQHGRRWSIRKLAPSSERSFLSRRSGKKYFTGTGFSCSRKGLALRPTVSAT